MTLQKDPERTETKYLHNFADFTLRQAQGGAGRRVLEIGCGDARLTWQYAESASQVAAIDLDQDSLRYALIDRASDLENKVLFSRADSIHLPFSKEKFDIAILAWSL